MGILIWRMTTVEVTVRFRWISEEVGRGVSDKLLNSGRILDCDPDPRFLDLKDFLRRDF